MHEETHKTIAEAHGCISGYINYLTIEPYFHCTEYEPRTIKTQLQEYQLHSENEIMTYNISTIFAQIFSLGVIGIIAYAQRTND